MPVPPTLRCLLAAAVIVVSATAAASARAAAPDPARAIAPESTAAAVATGRALGFENLSAGGPGSTSGLSAPPRIAFEDRRDRHAADALGRADAAGLAGWDVVVRRLGLPAARIAPRTGAWPPEVRHPMAAGSGTVPGPVERPTARSLDLIIRPLFEYELGRIYDPVMIRTGIQPELIANPWPGARARLSWVFPLRNDFEVTPIEPDVNRSRPGPQTLEQYGWMGPAGLGSATFGLFSSNRWGLSLGLARPFAQGEWLMDGQLDATGFWASTDSGITYSEIGRTSGHVGVTWRPHLPVDVAFRVQGHRYLYGDDGVQLEMERTLGDLDVAFVAQLTRDETVGGLRVSIPLPPGRRPTGWPVRVLPPERIVLEYRDTAGLMGLTVPDVASREDFLRQLSAPALRASEDRWRRERGEPAAPRPPMFEPTSWVGMTGFVTTPWCGVLPDRGAAAGYAKVPKEASWDHRGTHSNEVYYASLGILPRTEVGLRWTVIPGLKTFEDVVPDTRLTDSDRMVSARVAVLNPDGWRPGLALGIEDATGTRRFHSTYVVTGIQGDAESLRARLSLGYAHPVLEASRHVLDGVFGAGEVSYRRVLTVAVDHDIERWNAALGLYPGYGLHVRAALFDLQHVGISVGWFGSL